MYDNPNPNPNRNRIRHCIRLVVAVAVAGIVLLLLADPALAAPTPPPAVNDLSTVIRNLRWWIMGMIGSVATLFLVIGGARYMMAGGDPSEIERAKGNLKSAGYGYGLALLAPVLMTILNSILVQ